MTSYDKLTADVERESEHALLERPGFSIRARIILAFLMSFFFLLSFVITTIFYISRMNSKQDFLEDAANFSFNIQQARRHEKNYILYHDTTDLFDAIDYVRKASYIFKKNDAELRSSLQSS